MNTKSFLDMTDEEIAAAREQDRLDREQQEAAERERARHYNELLARRDAISRQEAKARKSELKKTRKSVAEAQTDLVVELLKDRALAFAQLFSGMNASDVQRHLTFMAGSYRPESQPAQAAQTLIAQAQQAVNRKVELAEGAL